MRALVTGGTGFLGGAIARRLLARGDDVTLFSRTAAVVDAEAARAGAATAASERTGEPEQHASRVGRAHHVSGDVADRAAVERAAEDCDVVFHVAARVGGWGPRADYHRVNVDGTANVIAACRRHSVARLVYTSTPSVVHDGGDLEGVGEDMPYARHFDAAYPETKAIAEQLVLAANDATLSTVALRPHLIWGPGDNQLIPRLLERARAGRLRLVAGGRKRVDATYIDNAAEAHVLAADRLAPDAACAGRAYFIAQGEPAPAHELINGVLAAADLPPVTRSVPETVAWLLGASAEIAYKLTGRTDEPPLTRFAARQLSTAHWFDLEAARRDLGYEPKVRTAEGMRRLHDALRAERTGRATG